MFGVIVMAIMVLTTSQNTNSELSPKNVIESYKLIEELFDAYNRKDYVDVWIKLIDLKLNLNRPQIYSKEMITLLILRRRLVILHKYYLKMFPSKAPTKDFTNIYDEGWLLNQDISSILNVLGVIAQETNFLTDTSIKTETQNNSEDQLTNLFGSIASTLIKTTEDALSSNVPQGNPTSNLSNTEKPKLGAAPSPDIKFSEQTNSAIYDAMQELSNLVESAPCQTQTNSSPTPPKTSPKTTTVDTPNDDDGDALNEAIGSFFNIFSGIASSADQTAYPNSRKLRRH